MKYVVAVNKFGKKWLYRKLPGDYLEFICKCGEKYEAFMPYLLDPDGFDMCMKCELPFLYFVDFEFPTDEEVEEYKLKVRRDGYIMGTGK